MNTHDFDYELPSELIAQEPPARRDQARLLVLSRADGTVSHRNVADLPELMNAGDLVVVNDTRVIPARLFARRATGGAVEVFLLGACGDGTWSALVRAGGALREGEVLDVTDGERPIGAGVRLVRRLGDGRWTVAGEGADLSALMDAVGKMPLPPYIRRERRDPREALDRERYQTVFARRAGAVAAPTAGLHLTDELLARLRGRGVEIATVTLHVGLGTFRPIETERVEDHVMHEEAYDVPRETADAVRRARAAGGRIVAVGTTSVRTLETASSSEDGVPVVGSGVTRLFIAPGSRFRAVDALMTNFHLPRSTLLCLISAFAGRERVLAAYREAVARRYRFYSYGDAMFIA